MRASPAKCGDLAGLPFVVLMALNDNVLTCLANNIVGVKGIPLLLPS